MDAQTIWEATLDQNEYLCRVTRTSDRMGRLTVVKKENGATLLDKQVGLSYGAVWGPDFEDVLDWQDMCMLAVDNQK